VPAVVARTWTRSQIWLATQPSTARLLGLGAAAPGERVADPTAVGDLEEQPLGAAPELEHPLAVRVADAVRGHLVHGRHEIVGALGVEVGLRCEVDHEPADGTERIGGEAQLVRGRRRTRQGVVERRFRRAQAAIPVAPPLLAPLVDPGMTAKRLVDHRVAERGGVVGAEQPEGRHAREGEVEQRFVALALDELGALMLGPDRLPDPANGPAVGPVDAHEIEPGGDDPRRVRAQLAHVGEEHTVGVAAEHAAQAFDPLRRQGNEHGLARGDAVADERERAVEELVLVRVEERLV
jgi:hypothetical protein